MSGDAFNGPILHVAALPFPSPQGTQAAIAGMLECLASAGRDVHLLCYPHGAGEQTFSYPVHRATDLARFRSLRSGASARKLLADVELAAALRSCLTRIRPSVVIAHHVEAAMVTSRCERRVFFAHTALAGELPTYAMQEGDSRPPPAARSIFSRAGALLDTALVRRAHAIAAVSPLLTQQLRELVPSTRDRIRCVLPPWQSAERDLPFDRHATERARLALGIDENAYVWLYSGNLDAYQGWHELVRAVAITQALVPELVLLVATASDPRPMLAEAERAGIRKRVMVRQLVGEDERALAHAAADAVAVPRSIAGGLPIKLLDAMSRGVPCVVTPSACAGLPIDDCVVLAARDDGEALAAALLHLIARPELRGTLIRDAAEYVRAHHSHEAFLRSFDDLLDLAMAS
jgi:glycosyltransferase involved in cell wall biosynthesis